MQPVASDPAEQPPPPSTAQLPAGRRRLALPPPPPPPPSGACDSNPSLLFVLPAGRTTSRSAFRRPRNTNWRSRRDRPAGARPQWPRLSPRRQQRRPTYSAVPQPSQPPRLSVFPCQRGAAPDGPHHPGRHRGQGRGYLCLLQREGALGGGGKAGNLGPSEMFIRCPAALPKYTICLCPPLQLAYFFSASDTLEKYLRMGYPQVGRYPTAGPARRAIPPRCPLSPRPHRYSSAATMYHAAAHVRALALAPITHPPRCAVFCAAQEPGLSDLQDDDDGLISESNGIALLEQIGYAVSDIDARAGARACRSAARSGLEGPPPCQALLARAVCLPTCLHVTLLQYTPSMCLTAAPWTWPPSSCSPGAAAPWGPRGGAAGPCGLHAACCGAPTNASDATACSPACPALQPALLGWHWTHHAHLAQGQGLL